MTTREKQDAALDALVEKLDTGEKINEVVGDLIKGLFRAEQEMRLNLAYAAMAGEADDVRRCREKLARMAEYMEVVHEHPAVQARIKAHKEKEEKHLDELGCRIVGMILK